MFQKEYNVDMLCDYWKQIIEREVLTYRYLSSCTRILNAIVSVWYIQSTITEVGIDGFRGKLVSGFK